MTVRELIEKLKPLDQEKQIFVNGYEGGADDVTELLEKKFVLNKYKDHDSDFLGAHEIYELTANTSYDVSEGYKVINGYLIVRP